MIVDGLLRVTVGILTYRRPDDLAAGLPMVLEQINEINSMSPNDYSVDLLVVDNDPLGGGAEVVKAIGSPLVRYSVEPRPGVSAARNRALEECAGIDLLAFIDDDERPRPGWLERLLHTHRITGSAAVAGRVVPEYQGELDPWIAAGRFFVRRSLPSGTEVEAAGAGNLLLDLRDLRGLGLRFDERFGLSGGEDTLLTRSLSAQGGAIAWCNEAVVVDKVPSERLSRRWVLRRAWSHGNSFSLVAVALASSPAGRWSVRLKMLTSGVLRVCGGALRATFGIITGSLVHQARGARAAWRGSGMAAGVFGLVYHEYDRADRRRSQWKTLRRPAISAGSRSGKKSDDFVVLLSFPPTKPRGNPYRVLLENSLRATPGLTVRNFSWRTALTSRYDAFHVHWPEILVNGSNPSKAVVRQLMFAALLLRSRLTRTPLIRTVHNLDLPTGIAARSCC